MKLQETSTLRIFLYSRRQPFFPNTPHAQTFLTPKWAIEEGLCLNNNLAFRDRNSTKFRITVI